MQIKKRKQFSKFFGIDLLNFDTPPKPKNNGIHLVIADTHAPFHHKEYFNKTIEDNKDADVCWIAGDFFDMYSKSRFRKTRTINFREEFAESYNELKRLCGLFPKVKIMLTNHDTRFEKWIYDVAPNDLIEFCHMDLMDELLNLIPNLKIVRYKLGERGIGHIYQYKNVIFTHIEKSNKDITKTVQEIEKDLQRWSSVYKFKPYNVVMQAHNHTSGKVKFDGKWLIQIPCLIDIQQHAFDYVFNGKIVGNPPALGYIRMKEIKGKIDPSTIQIIDLN